MPASSPSLSGRSSRLISSRALLVAATLTALFAFYAPTLELPFASDDFDLLSITWSEWLGDPLAANGRPLWSLSGILVNAISSTPLAHRLVNLLLYLAVAFLALQTARQHAGDSVAAVLAVLAALLHPSFIWPVTWIAQRADLLLILALLMAVRYLDGRSGIVWVGLASAAKSPFLAQNLFFALKMLKARRYAALALVMAFTAVPLWGGYVTYYGKDAAQASEGLFRLDGAGLGDGLFILLSRSAKIVEGLVYVLMPFPAFGHALLVMAAAALAYLLCWTGVGFLIFKNARATGRPTAAPTMLVIGLLLSLGLAFGTTLRIYAPVVPFLYLAAGLAIRDGPAARTMLAAIMLLNLAGTALNYRIFTFDAQAAHVDCHVIDRSKVDICGTPTAIPVNEWFTARGEIVNKLIAAQQ